MFVNAVHNKLKFEVFPQCLSEIRSCTKYCEIQAVAKRTVLALMNVASPHDPVKIARLYDKQQNVIELN